jgi:hypothetical protein
MVRNLSEILKIECVIEGETGPLGFEPGISGLEGLKAYIKANEI